MQVLISKVIILIIGALFYAPLSSASSDGILPPLATPELDLASAIPTRIIPLLPQGSRSTGTPQDLPPLAPNRNAAPATSSSSPVRASTSAAAAPSPRASAPAASSSSRSVPHARAVPPAKASPSATASSSSGTSATARITTASSAPKESAPAQKNLSALEQLQQLVIEFRAIETPEDGEKIQSIITQVTPLITSPKDKSLSSFHNREQISLCVGELLFHYDRLQIIWENKLLSTWEGHAVQPMLENTSQQALIFMTARLYYHPTPSSRFLRTWQKRMRAQKETFSNENILILIEIMTRFNRDKLPIPEPLLEFMNCVFTQSEPLILNKYLAILEHQNQEIVDDLMEKIGHYLELRPFAILSNTEINTLTKAKILSYFIKKEHLNVQDIEKLNQNPEILQQLDPTALAQYVIQISKIKDSNIPKEILIFIKEMTNPLFFAQIGHFRRNRNNNEEQPHPHLVYLIEQFIKNEIPFDKVILWNFADSGILDSLDKKENLLSKMEISLKDIIYILKEKTQRIPYSFRYLLQANIGSKLKVSDNDDINSEEKALIFNALSEQNRLDLIENKAWLKDFYDINNPDDVWRYFELEKLLKLNEALSDHRNFKFPTHLELIKYINKISDEIPIDQISRFLWTEIRCVVEQLLQQNIIPNDTLIHYLENSEISYSIPDSFYKIINFIVENKEGKIPYIIAVILKRKYRLPNNIQKLIEDNPKYIRILSVLLKYENKHANTIIEEIREIYGTESFDNFSEDEIINIATKIQEHGFTDMGKLLLLGRISIIKNPILSQNASNILQQEVNSELKKILSANRNLDSIEKIILRFINKNNNIEFFRGNFDKTHLKHLITKLILINSVPNDAILKLAQEKGIVLDIFGDGLNINDINEILLQMKELNTFFDNINEALERISKILTEKGYTQEQIEKNGLIFYLLQSVLHTSNNQLKNSSIYTKFTQVWFMLLAENLRGLRDEARELRDEELNLNIETRLNEIFPHDDYRNNRDYIYMFIHEIFSGLNNYLSVNQDIDQNKITHLILAPLSKIIRDKLPQDNNNNIFYLKEFQFNLETLALKFQDQAILQDTLDK